MAITNSAGSTKPRTRGRGSYVAPGTNIETDVAVLKHRVTNVESGLKKEREVRAKVDAEHYELLLAIKNKNHVTEFVQQYWKVLAVLYLISTREDAQAIFDALVKLMM